MSDAATPSRRRRFGQMARRLLLLVAGTALTAFGYVVFQVPFNLAAGGIGGISLIINHFTGWPLGLMYFIMNLPLLLLGYRQLGRLPFVAGTLLSAGLFAIFTDTFVYYLPEIISPYPLTDNILLNTVYGGILGGVGGGLVFRAGSTTGGTSIIGRLIQHRTGQPLSQTYFYTDGAILLALGIVFGWEVTLYGLLMVFINGMASDYTLEGPSSTRVATIVTTQPDAMVAAVMATTGRGATYWSVVGGYTGQPRTLVTCTMARSQVNQVKAAVVDADPGAFLTIGVSHEALGEGFRPLM